MMMPEPGDNSPMAPSVRSLPVWPALPKVDDLGESFALPPVRVTLWNETT